MALTLGTYAFGSSSWKDNTREDYSILTNRQKSLLKAVAVDLALIGYGPGTVQTIQSVAQRGIGTAQSINFRKLAASFIARATSFLSNPTTNKTAKYIFIALITMLACNKIYQGMSRLGNAFLRLLSGDR